MTAGPTTKLEAPDGGWGILVCFGMAMPFVSALAALPSFGLVFGDFLQSIGAETSAIAFITSAFFCFFSFAGLFSGSLFARYGLRPVGLIGGVLYFIGSLLQVFVTSTLWLVIAFSALQGVAFGLIVPTSYTTFNNYFVKKRIVWMSFAQSLIGLGTMVYPVVMQKLMELYGFRGCLLVLAAINSHAILGMLLMQPVEWHMRQVLINAEERIEMVCNEPRIEIETEDEPQRLPSADSPTSLQPVIQDIHHLTPLMAHVANSPNLSKEEKRIISSRSSSITSLGNWSGPIVVSDASPQMTHTPTSRRQSRISSAYRPVIVSKTKWQIVVDFLDLTLLKNPIYVNIVLGISFALYSDIAFFTLQPVYLFTLDYSKADTANIISIGAAADLGSRIFLAFSAVYIQMPSRYIYLAGSFFTIIARFAFLNVFDFKGMAIITAVMGFFRTWIHVPLPLVFAEYLPKERFASGYGLFMFLQGNITFVVGPLVGYIRDTTQDYILTFHCLSFFMALCVVPWLLEIVLLKFRRRSNLDNSINTSNIVVY